MVDVEAMPLLEPGEGVGNTHPIQPFSKSAPSKEALVCLPLHVETACERCKPKLQSWRSRVTTALAGIILAACCTLFFWPRSSTPAARVISVPSGTNNPAFLVKAYNGAVSTENQNCSNIGVDVLKDGGNAVDAAVASTLCVGVASMFSSGIGGGGFLTVRVPGDGVYTIDFRETAPDKANKTMFGKDPLSSLFGGLSVGVPGELRGLQEMHNRWGKLPWSRLVTPSAKLAEGWFVGPELARRLVMFQEFMESDPDWAATFAPRGTILREGEWISRANLSRTLYTIAERGPDAFYTGPIAESLVSKIRETGGVMTLEDFASYKVHVDRAFEGSFRGRKVFTTHPPSSGIVLLHVLNLIERYNFPEEGLTGLNFHRFVEALKYGSAARTRLGDPVFIPDHTLIHEIPTHKFADAVAANITDDTTHTYEYYNPVFDVPEDHGTMHLSVVDKDHMAVAVTSTVNLVFGSRVLDTNTGIILNDELDDFSRPGIPNYFGLYPSPYNYPEATKRPLSSTCPTIIENADGTLYAVLGASGGSRIYPAVAQVIAYLDIGRTISEAIEGPRAHDQLLPPRVDLDSTFPEDLIQALRDRHHNVTVADINGVKAVVQGVVVQDGVIWAAADSRKNGIAAGY